MNNNNNNNKNIKPPYTRFHYAVTDMQKNSLAELKETYKYALYEDVTTENRENYFQVSVKPITKTAEDDMELLSDIVTWGEEFRYHWKTGVYKCAQCSIDLFHSNDKWEGPCVWPSFRKPINDENVELPVVTNYNNYSVTVKEVYCKKCNLFIGHAFEDGKKKGDTHPNAHWRF